MSKWDDVTPEDLQQVIEHLEQVNCSHHAKVCWVLKEKLSEMLWGKSCDTCKHWDGHYSVCHASEGKEKDCREMDRRYWEKKNG